MSSGNICFNGKREKTCPLLNVSHGNIMKQNNLKPEKPKIPKADETLDRVSHDLRERVKELNCLYAISELFEKSGISLDEILQGTINAIPSAWQYPDITCARIAIGNRYYVTKGFKDTKWKLSREFVAGPDDKGILEICYKEARPSLYRGPFVKEETKLAKVIAEKLGKIVWTKLAEKSLQESEELYRAMAEHVTDGVALLQGGRIIFMNAAFAELFGLKSEDIEKSGNAGDLISKGQIQCDDNIFAFDGKGSGVERKFTARLAARDGRESWIEGERVVIRFKGRQAVLYTLRDCTDRIRRESAIKEEAESLRRENIHLRSSMKERYRFRNIIGKSQAMQEVYELILKASSTDASTAILGESGTGKELVARAIHELSVRRDKEFVTVNCGAIPENLLESEFFGHKKGSFTGAYADKMGYLDIADGGTLFLDETGELTLNMQIKLLRAIDGKDYTPVGSNKLKRSNFRVIAATNRNLADLVREGVMREDFFYRIHVIPIALPSLRERREDIPLLVDHFLNAYLPGEKKPVIPAKIIDSMMSYSWPGNVRELQNVIRRYLSVGRWDFIKPVHGPQKESRPDSYSLKGSVEDLEKTAVKNALEQSRWNRSMAAELLGISRRSLFRKMEKYGLS